MGRAESFREAIRAEEPDIRAYVEGDTLVVLGLDPEAALRDVRRLRASRQFKDVRVEARKVDVTTC